EPDAGQRGFLPAPPCRDRDCGNPGPRFRPDQWRRLGPVVLRRIDRRHGRGGAPSRGVAAPDAGVNDPQDPGTDTLKTSAQVGDRLNRQARSDGSSGLSSLLKKRSANQTSNPSRRALSVPITRAVKTERKWYIACSTPSRRSAA